jgi:hypothetical protein
LAPWAGSATEHVPAHDRRADIRLRFFDHGRAGIALATLQAVLPAPRLQPDDPFMQILAAHAERMILALVGAGDESIEGNGYVEPDLAHRPPFRVGVLGSHGFHP